jgi:RNA polymerase sporulation-specific sigma factor
MIAGEIRRYLRDNSSVRISRSMRDTAYQALQVKERLTAEKNREPDTDEIAREMGVDRQEVYFALDAITEPVSIYEPIFSDGGESLCVMDQIGDRHNTDNSWIEQLTLSEAMKSLGLREKKILALRFFEGKTQMEVAQDVGISQAQVSRLEKNALGHIKKYIGVE